LYNFSFYFLQEIGANRNFSLAFIWSYQAQKELLDAAKRVQGSKKHVATTQAHHRPM